ncbi:MAG: AAA family ATPase [Spirochaetota bacterium]
MFTVEGFELKDKINNNEDILIYRAIRKSDNQAVVLKYLPIQKNNTHLLVNIKKEYELLKVFNSEKVIRPLDFLIQENGYGLVLEDGGDSLKNRFITNQKKQSIPDFLKIAIQLASILMEVHKKKIVHKDIKPNNFVVSQNKGNLEIKIIDFGISTSLKREEIEWKSPEILEGSLPYISPEQTGRINKAIDYRSDFYSLGVTFYELVTGELPFKSNDPIELIHSHIAKHQIHVSDMDPSVPTMVSQIIDKLMQKDADKRYKNAIGLEDDLQKCLNYCNGNAKIPKFILGEKDFSDVFKIPQKLYGREKRIQELVSIFEKVSEGNTELLLVSGYSGIGKSAFIQETHKPITEKSGYFISGKFDQFQRNIPFSAITHGFRELMKHLLMEPEKTLATWKEKISQALGVNAKIMIDVIPELEYIIGKQPDVESLGSSENENRFKLTFQNFISIFTKKEHPIVIFLDDLQWADTPSFQLLQYLIADPNSKYLFIIGAYRDNEVDASHPLSQAISDIEKGEKELNRISMEPLSKDDILNLLCDTLHTQRNRELQDLSELLLSKTGGNPFFLSELLKTLYKEEIIEFDYIKQMWLWSQGKIFDYGITDNVVDLMVDTIRNFPQKTLELLSISACLGNNFSIGVLHIVSEITPIDIAKYLWICIEEGMLIPIGRAYAALQAAKDGLGEINLKDLLNSKLKFQHDRVQQAAYGLIGETKKKEIHYKAGNLILASVEEQEKEEKIFEIISHLNKGKELIQKDQERVELIQLNLRAGKKAKQSTAYEAAVRYLQLGLELSKNSLSHNEKLENEILKESSESLYLSGKHEEAEESYNILIQRISNFSEKSDIYSKILTLYEGSGKFDEGVRFGVKILKEHFNITIPLTKEEQNREIGKLLGQAFESIEITGLDNILSLQENNNKEVLECLNFLIALFAISYFTNIEIFTIIILSAILLTLKHGNSIFSSYAFVSFGSLLCTPILKKYDLGFIFGKMALDIYQTYPNRSLECKINAMYAAFIQCWGQHLKNTMDYLPFAREKGLQTGDLSYASYAEIVRIRNLISFSNGLQETSKEIDGAIAFLQKINQPAIVLLATQLKYMVEKYRSYNSNITLLEGGDFSEKNFIDICKNTEFYLGLYLFYYYKLMTSIIFADKNDAKKYAEILKGNIGLIGPLIHTAEICFYTLLYCFQEDTSFDIELKNQYFDNLKELSKHCPDNFGHKYLLVEAEKARAEGKNFEAITLYEKSIESAKKHKFTHIEALGNELCAKFWMNKGNKKYATLHMTEAHRLYEVWGALAKCKQLEEKYSDSIEKGIESSSGFVKQRELDKTITTNKTIIKDSTTFTTSLDLTSILRASQALSKEIEYEKLLEKLIKILIENAGAERVILISHEEKDFFVDTDGNANTKTVYKANTNPLSKAKNIPISIINYVIRSKQNLVLQDVANDQRFQTDPYITTKNSKSILCAPLTYQGKLTGLIYLENNVMTGAFTEERVHTLQTLASQAAISIDNAKLYNNLEKRVKARTQEIGDIMDTVEQGILTINSDFTINPEYSKKVIEIFGKDDFGNKDFRDIFTTEEKEKLTKFLNQLFKNKYMSEKMFASINPLKEYELVRNDGKQKHLAFHFSRIYLENRVGKASKEIDKLMVVIDDRTKEYKLQKQLEEKASEQTAKVEKLYQILNLEANVFTEFLQEGSEVIAIVRSKLSRGVKTLQDSKNIEESYRAVHTLKGNARALNLDGIGEVCHSLEDELDKVRKNTHGVDETLYQLIQTGIERIDLELQDGNNLFEKILGMKSALQNKAVTPLSSLESLLRNIAKKESEEQGKSVHLSFQSELVNPISADTLKVLKNSLLQIVRNSIGHGLEKSTERKQLGKPEKGRISITFKKRNDQLCIICEDDGRGLDIERLQQKAIERGIISAKEAATFKKGESYDLIFHSGFSTAEKVTGTSGRGVGMDIVKTEIENKGGKIEVESSKGNFTKFTIIV